MPSSPSSLVPQATVPPRNPSDAMANFPVNPLAFLPDGMTIEQGLADRKVRSDLVVNSIPPLRHDNVVIAEANHFIPIAEYGPDVTAEQIYQTQLNNWVLQNQQFLPQGQHHQNHNMQQQQVQQQHIQQQQMQHGEPEDEIVHAAPPPLINFQAIMAKQGLMFPAGVPPAVNNLADSPMQAYHDAVMDSESSSSDEAGMQIVPSTALTLNMMRTPSRFAANEQALNNRNMSATMDSICFLPSLSVDDVFHLSSQFVLPLAVGFELIGEAFMLCQSKQINITESNLFTAQKVKKSSVQIVELDEQTDVEVLDVAPPASKKRKIFTPDCTTVVRRSMRSTRYAGFKPSSVSDNKKVKSKVKPWCLPSLPKTSLHILLSKCFRTLVSCYVVFLVKISLHRSC